MAGQLVLVISWDLGVGGQGPQGLWCGALVPRHMGLSDGCLASMRYGGRVVNVSSLSERKREIERVSRADAVLPF